MTYSKLKKNQPNFRAYFQIFVKWIPTENIEDFQEKYYVLEVDLENIASMIDSKDRHILSVALDYINRTVKDPRSINDDIKFHRINVEKLYYKYEGRWKRDYNNGIKERWALIKLTSKGIKWIFISPVFWIWGVFTVVYGVINGWVQKILSFFGLLDKVMSYIKRL